MIRRSGAAFEEWKPESVLEPLSARMPERYQPQSGGGWHCPPGEAAVQELGLTYRVRTTKEYHPHYIQNLKFLQDFWTHSYAPVKQAEDSIKEAVTVYPGSAWLSSWKLIHPFQHETSFMAHPGIWPNQQQGHGGFAWLPDGTTLLTGGPIYDHNTKQPRFTIRSWHIDYKL